MKGSRRLRTARITGRDAAGAVQIEFALRIPICAWCRPRRGLPDPGTVSHGICPRHFRQIIRQVQRPTCPAAQAQAAALPNLRLTQCELQLVA